jgi:hypothetical protein
VLRGAGQGVSFCAADYRDPRHRPRTVQAMTVTINLDIKLLHHISRQGGTLFNCICPAREK